MRNTGATSTENGPLRPSSEQAAPASSNMPNSIWPPLTSAKRVSCQIKVIRYGPTLDPHSTERALRLLCEAKKYGAVSIVRSRCLFRLAPPHRSLPGLLSDCLSLHGLATVVFCCAVLRLAVFFTAFKRFFFRLVGPCSLPGGTGNGLKAIRLGFDGLV